MGKLGGHHGMHNSIYGFIFAICVGGLFTFIKDAWPDAPPWFVSALFWLSLLVGLVAIVAYCFERGWLRWPTRLRDLASALEAPRQRPWPDFKALDKRSDFELYEAACLWFDEEPVLPMFDDAFELYQEWRSVIEAGEMPARFTHDPLNDAISSAMAKAKIPPPKAGENFGALVTPHTRVSRGVLRGWAEIKGEKPRFLYPERRGER
jgi:hypothetical protein